MSKKNEEKKVEQHHSGSVAPEDENLTKWVIDLWSRKEHPERIEVWQVFGKEKSDRGEMVFHRDFSPDEKLDPEKCNHLANSMIAEAQNDTDGRPKCRGAYFQIYVTDRNRRAVPLVRRLGPFQPKRISALARGNDSSEGGETDEEEMSLRTLEHARLKTGFEEVRWGSVRNDRVLGELLLLFRDVTQEQRDELRILRAEAREREKAMQEALDLRLQRELVIEEKKFSIGLKKEAMRMGRNLLPSLFAEARESQQIPQNGHSNGNGNGHSDGHAQQSQPTYGPSTERTHVDSFMTDCEEVEGLMDKLTGEAEEVNGKLVMTKPGILNPKQVAILVGVRGGFLPPEALDPIMPESGHALEITMEQISKAMAAGVTEGIGMALIELKETRKKARERDAATAAPPPTKPTTDNPAPEATT